MADDRRSSRRLPLEALRVFEAAARHLNFTAAARELGVTQAAVSRRVQALEAEIGQPLFLRRGRRLAPTAVGERLGRRVRAALDHLAEGLADLAGEGPALTLAASGSVSHFWLGPALRAFARAEPETAVRLLTTDDMGALAAETNDVAIIYGAGDHPRWRLSRLFPERLAPVASPALVAERGSDLAAYDLLDYEPFNAHWRTLRDWRRWARVDAGRRGRAAFTTYATAIEAAVRGDGAALGSLDLLADQIRAGLLTQICGPVWVTGAGYHVGLPKARPASPAAEALRATLLARAATRAAERETGT